MRVRSSIYLLMFGTTAVLIGAFFGSRRLNLPLTLEFVSLTNVPPSVTALPLWSAQDRRGEVSGLVPASPSHVLFRVTNRTRRPFQFRPLLYQFADSLPTGAVLPPGPSRHRGGHVRPPYPEELSTYKGMSFGPPHRDCATYRTLAPGEAALIPLPRPPFKCTWRVAIAYGLPLTGPEKLRCFIKARLHLGRVYNIISSPQGPAYDEWMFGAWITNTVPNEVVPRPRASRVGQEQIAPSLTVSTEGLVVCPCRRWMEARSGSRRSS